MEFARQIRACQRAEKARLALWRRQGCVVAPVRARARARGDQRPGVRRTVRVSRREDADPHIGSAPPSAVANHVAALREAN